MYVFLFLVLQECFTAGTMFNHFSQGTYVGVSLFRGVSQGGGFPSDFPRKPPKNRRGTSKIRILTKRGSATATGGRQLVSMRRLENSPHMAFCTPLRFFPEGAQNARFRKDP